MNKYNIDDVVYYIKDNSVRKHTIGSIRKNKLAKGNKIQYTIDGDDLVWYDEIVIHRTLDNLIEALKKTIE